MSNFSRKTEDVLLLLLKENEDLREGLQKEIELRERENAEIRDLFTKECENLREKLDIEEKQRKNEKEYLQGQIDKLVKELSDSKEKLQSQLDQERTERIKRLNKWVIIFIKKMRIARKTWKTSTSGSEQKTKSGWQKQKHYEREWKERNKSFRIFLNEITKQ